MNQRLLYVKIFPPRTAQCNCWQREDTKQYKSMEDLT